MGYNTIKLILKYFNEITQWNISFVFLQVTKIFSYKYFIFSLGTIHILQCRCTEDSVVLHLYFYNVLKRKLKESTQEATYNFLGESSSHPHSIWYRINRIPVMYSGILYIYNTEVYIATLKGGNLVLHMVENQQISFIHVKCLTHF